MASTRGKGAPKKRSRTQATTPSRGGPTEDGRGNGLSPDDLSVVLERFAERVGQPASEQAIRDLLAQVEVQLLRELEPFVSATAHDASAEIRRMRKAIRTMASEVAILTRVMKSEYSVRGRTFERELALAAQGRLENLIEVDQPLVLISQIARSGGTLLSQLLDGHPECHSHPFELELGFPAEDKVWPTVDLEADRDDWWAALWEPATERLSHEDYHKEWSTAQFASETFPFLHVPSLARRVFGEVLAARPPRAARDVFDAYMTAYFNAWLDNQNLYGLRKRWTVAFSPALALNDEAREGFFHDYPDGRVISIIREPKGWYASANAGRVIPEESFVSQVEGWIETVQTLLKAKRERPDQVRLVAFESLVRETRATMKEITSFLKIRLPAIALRPTFNGFDIKANSSFEVTQPGIIEAPARRGNDLEPELAARINAMTRDVYREARRAISAQQKTRAGGVRRATRRSRGAKPSGPK